MGTHGEMGETCWMFEMSILITWIMYLPEIESPFLEEV